MRILVDAMGGDYAPQAIVAGVIEAIKEFDVTIALIGVRDKVEAELQKHTYDNSKIEVLDAPEVVGMHEPATVSIRKKRNSSIALGIDALKEKKFDAFVSAGNTGAVVAASTIKLRMLQGVERPGIGLVVPNIKKFSFIIDVGANTDPKPQHLLQSALMAKVYATAVLGVANPTIGLMNIGEEASKGTDFVKTTHQLFIERLEGFVGNVEDSELFTGKCDCIICDGYAGNIVIKVSEGLMESAAKLLRAEIKKSPLALFGAMLMKSRLNHIKKYADYSEYGGAPLLGVNGIVMISHGRSSPKAIKNAIRATVREIEHNLLTTMVNEISAGKTAVSHSL